MHVDTRSAAMEQGAGSDRVIGIEGAGSYGAGAAATRPRSAGGTAKVRSATCTSTAPSESSPATRRAPTRDRGV